MTPLASTLWWISLAIGLVVTIVAAILLVGVIRVAQRIKEGAQAIWTTGKLVARNTAQIPLLIQTNQVAADIAEETNGILMAAGRIQRHAQNCPGCPGCLLGEGKS
jgi:hypothetical protein